MVACSMVEATFFGGVYGVGETFGGMAEFCDGCNIDLGLPCSVRLSWLQLARFGSLGAQPHAARVKLWPWAKLTIARPLVIEQVTEEQDRADKKCPAGIEISHS